MKFDILKENLKEKRKILFFKVFKTIAFGGIVGSLFFFADLYKLSASLLYNGLRYQHYFYYGFTQAEDFNEVPLAQRVYFEDFSSPENIDSGMGETIGLDQTEAKVHSEYLDARYDINGVPQLKYSIKGLGQKLGVDGKYPIESTEILGPITAGFQFQYFQAVTAEEDSSHTIRFQFLSSDGGTLISDADVPGNSNGFRATDKLVNISGIPNRIFYIKIIFTNPFQGRNTAVLKYFSVAYLALDVKVQKQDFSTGNVSVAGGGTALSETQLTAGKLVQKEVLFSDATNFQIPFDTTENYVFEDDKVFIENNKVKLQRQPLFDVSDNPISVDLFNTNEVALDDLDDDGNLDVIMANSVGINRWYQNNGTESPFSGSVGQGFPSSGGLHFDGDDDYVDIETGYGNNAISTSIWFRTDKSSRKQYESIYGITTSLSGDGANPDSGFHGRGELALDSSNRISAYRIVTGCQRYQIVSCSGWYTKKIGDTCYGNFSFGPRVTTGQINPNTWVNTWNHVVTTMNYDTLKLSVYNNGTLAGTASALPSTCYEISTDNVVTTITNCDAMHCTDNERYTWLGRRKEEGRTNFQGSIDSVQKFNKELTDAEVKTLYRSHLKTPITTNLLGSWSFDTEDINGSVALDLSGLGNDGTIYGPVPTTGKDQEFVEKSSSVATGDVNGDGYIDVVFGNQGTVNHLYFNNGTSEPFKDVSPVQIGQVTNMADQSLYFDGINDYVDIDNADAKLTGSQSIAFWYKTSPLKPSNWVQIVGGGSFSGSSDKGHSIGINRDTNQFVSDLYNGEAYGSQRSYFPVDRPLDNQWHFAVSVYDQVTQTHKIYLDKTLFSVDLDAASYWTDDTIEWGTTKLEIGRSAGNDNWYFNGFISDLRIYNRVLTQNEIDTLRTNVTDNDIVTDGLVGFWSFDTADIAGTQALDRSSFENYGTIYGATPADGVILPDLSSSQSVNLSDMDGDGDLDLIVGNKDAQNLLYLNNGTDFPFEGVAGMPIDSEIHTTFDILVEDLNSDGNLDIIAANGGNIGGQMTQLYLNNGTSSPFDGVLKSNISSDTKHVWDAELGDVDGDGDLDLVTANDFQPNRLYLNNGSANPFADVVGTDINPDIKSTLVVKLADVDGDGKLDLITGNSTNTNDIYINDGSSSPFLNVKAIPLKVFHNNTWTLAIGDIDHDSDLDLVVGNWGTMNRFYPNTRNGVSFSEIKTGNIVTTKAHTTNGAWGDYDGDGDLDLFVTNFGSKNDLYKNNGDGTFLSIVTGNIVTDTEYSTDAEWGDYDGDGDLDLFVTNSFGTSYPNSLYRNDGNDIFTKMIIGEISNDVESSESASWGDYDGDGDLDLFVANYSTIHPNSLYKNNGDGTFTKITTGSIVTDLEASKDAEWGDYDGDGDLDLFVANSSTTYPNSLYRNDGNDAFTKITNVAPTLNNDFSNKELSYDAEWGDYDGDGDLDLFVANYGTTHPNALYKNNGNATFTKIIEGSIANDKESSTEADWGDYDGDGDLDLLVANATTSYPNSLYRNEGNDIFIKVVEGSIVNDKDFSYGGTWGDYDGDGDLDLFVSNYNTSLNSLYQNNLISTDYPNEDPSITFFQSNEWGMLSSFDVIYADDNEGVAEFQLSSDGSHFLFWDGTQWAEVTSNNDRNTESEVNNHIGSFPHGNVYIKAFLVSNGIQRVSIEEIIISGKGHSNPPESTELLGPFTTTASFRYFEAYVSKEDDNHYIELQFLSNIEGNLVPDVEIPDNSTGIRASTKTVDLSKVTAQTIYVRVKFINQLQDLGSASFDSFRIFYRETSVKPITVLVNKGIRLNRQMTQTICAHGICRKIQNKKTENRNYFIPTKTSLEWNSFLENAPADAFQKIYPTSCQEILDAGGDEGSKNYMIDSDGEGGQDPVETYCDMTSGVGF